MMIVIALSIALPVCFVVLLVGCLDCLLRKKKLETFRSRDTTDGRLDTAFSVDISNIPNSLDQVTIDPLPDILSKVSTVQPQRPQITCTERGNREANLTAVSVQRSFPRDHLTYLNEIGSGWFGKAIESEATQIIGGSFKNHVVVKMLKDDASKLEQKQFLDEVSAFRCLEDANIMSLLGLCTETAPFLVVLEFAAYGSLKNYLVQNRHDVEEMIASNRLVSFALDAASGLACLQRHDYVHNDLAARNCLVTSDHTLKIGDYGISDYLFKNEYYNAGSQLLPIRWMAPEILANVDGVWTARSYSKVSDMWSFGVLLWEIFSLGEFPYDNLTDNAVLQEVVLDRRLLPSDMDIKIPFKDRVWSIMVQCWQNPSDRLEVEQAFNNLEQLNRVRVDTLDVMSDFDQKWDQLAQNQNRTFNIGADLGSRIALAGSFLTDGSSSSDKSVLEEDAKSQDGMKSDDVFISIGGDGMHNSRHHDKQAVPTISVHSTDIAPRLNMQQHDNIKSGSKDQVSVENEITKSAVSPSHMAALRSSDQSAVKTSTPIFQGQNSGSYFNSINSPLSGEYMTATETFSASNMQEEQDKDSSYVDKDFSLDLEGKTFEQVLDVALQKPAKPSNGASGFNFPSQTEDEEYSDFVRTSPTAPGVDFTDFASADNHLSTKVVPAADKIEIEKSTFFSESVTHPTPEATFEDSNDFADFSKVTGENDSSDDDRDTFSDFVTSAPVHKASSAAIVVVAEVNAAVYDDIDVDVSKSAIGQDVSQDFDDFITSDFSLISGPEGFNQPTDTSTFSLDTQAHEEVADLKSETETSPATAAVSQEIVSTTKVVPDQNQNILSLENLPSDMSSLISDASLLNDDDLHLEKGTASNSAIQSHQLDIAADFDNSKGIGSLESEPSFPAHVPTSTDFIADNSNISDLVKNSSAFGSLDFLDANLKFNPSQSTDPAALEVNEITQSDGKKESRESAEKNDSSLELVFESMGNVGSKQEAAMSSSVPAQNSEKGEYAAVTELTNTEDFKPIENTDFKPIENTDFKPIENTDFEPIENTDFKPIENTEYFKPIENTDFKPIENTGDFKPIENTDFKPIENTEDFKPIDNTGDFKPIDNTEDFKPIENLLGLEFLPELSSSQAEQDDLQSANQGSGESTNISSAQETGSLIDF